MARYDRDYYRILGVHLEATEDEVRRAYRRLALQWHPDRNGGSAEASERFKEISEAYGVLMDHAKRVQYDRARRGTGPGDFHVSRDQVFRDLFTDPRASAIFDELARELQRMGLRVDRQDFQTTLFGGRTVMTGHVVVISPGTALIALARLALRACRSISRSALGSPGRDERAGGLGGPWLGPPYRLIRWVLGSRAGGGDTPLAAEDVTLPLRVTSDEARRGVRKQVSLPDGSDVVVQVPAGVANGTRLRLRGKGLTRGDGTRGDAYLAVEIS